MFRNVNEHCDRMSDKNKLFLSRKHCLFTGVSEVTNMDFASLSITSIHQSPLEMHAWCRFFIYLFSVHIDDKF